MYSPLQLYQVFSLVSMTTVYVNIMDHFGKVMELSTNMSMAALAEARRLADTVNPRKEEPTFSRVSLFLVLI